MLSQPSNLTPSVIAKIAELLGREPRGLEAVDVWDADNNPSVIRVASLVDNKPFPTQFWLVDKALNYQLDQLEAGGLIAELQVRIDQSETVKRAVHEDHIRYIQLREENMTADIKQRLIALSYFEGLQKRGIGGIADFSRVRCLHTYYAAHLLRANTVGDWLDQEFLEK